MKKSVRLPIHHAIENGFFQQVRFHADHGYDVNAKDLDGRTPLILCSAVDDDTWSVGLARLLIENGAKIALSDKKGCNALHHACINQRHQLVDVLLSALDCSALSRCHQGNTALHFAASLGSSDILTSLLRLLLRYKMNVDPKNRGGLTPLHQAFKSNNLTCGDLLMEFGADPDIKVPSSNKCGHQLRKEAVERLEVISRLTAFSSAADSRTARKLQKDANMDKPEPAKAHIKEAKSFDKRNDPEYVFNMSAIDYFQQKVVRDIMETAKRSKLTRTAVAAEAWKEELLGMWHCYESQHSDSYRKPAKFVAASADIMPGGLSHRISMLSSSAAAGRRHLKSGVKSRAGSVTSADGSHPQRRPSITSSRRSGMPPLVRMQSRAAFNIH